METIMMTIMMTLTSDSTGVECTMHAHLLYDCLVICFTGLVGSYVSHVTPDGGFFHTLGFW